MSLTLVSSDDEDTRGLVQSDSESSSSSELPVEFPTTLPSITVDNATVTNFTVQLNFMSPQGTIAGVQFTYDQQTLQHIIKSIYNQPIVFQINGSNVLTIGTTGDVTIGNNLIIDGTAVIGNIKSGVKTGFPDATTTATFISDIVTNKFYLVNASGNIVITDPSLDGYDIYVKNTSGLVINITSTPGVISVAAGTSIHLLHTGGVWIQL